APARTARAAPRRRRRANRGRSRHWCGFGPRPSSAALVGSRSCPDYLSGISTALWDTAVENARLTDQTGGGRRVAARSSLLYIPEPIHAAPQGAAPDGHVAEWLRNGLQNRVPRFNSGRGLQQKQGLRGRPPSKENPPSGFR